MRAIVAMDPNRVIGKNGGIPWHLSEDFKFFKQATMGQFLLMGRITFWSIGRPLQGRYTYVLSNNADKLSLPNRDLCGYVTEREVFDFPYQHRDQIWVCGGASVYQRFLPLCSSIYVTHVLDDYEGDVYMPYFEDQFPKQEIIQENKDFWIVRYSK